MHSVNGSPSDPYHLLPEHMREGMRAYVEFGQPVGSFLKEVLCNDLMGALSNADNINLYSLPEYGRFLYNYAPAHCYGSVENYERWVRLQGMKNEERKVAGHG